MGRILAILLILLLFLFSLPFPTDASDVSLEKSLQNNLEKSRGIIKKAQERLKAGYPITAEINELKALYEEMKASHLLLEDRFRLRQEETKAHGAKAFERHRVMSDNYSRSVRDFLSLIEGLSPAMRNPQPALRNLETLLDQLLPKKKKPIFGSLPYKHLKYSSREPNESTPIKPAYKGGNKTATPDDLKSTLEAPITKEIGTLAQSLTWNPVLIYEWVKNSIETEWYWGCMKGAEETLRQRRGNDCDQAALLIALLRASGYPSRYVRGIIEFFPDIERAKNLTGINDPSKIAEYFQRAGVPYKSIIAGGRVSNIQIEHIWVETQVPYANYRGAILDEHGKTWLGLDASIKVTGYTYNTPIDILQEVSLSNIRDDYLSAFHPETPLEYLRSRVEAYLQTRNPQPATYDELLRKRTLIPEVMNILPASMQFKQTKITHEYTEMPDELKHKVRFIATRNSQPATSNTILGITLDALKLSNQKVAISYEPETVEDQEIINSYGGLDNTPAYLIRLRPVLKINGERVEVGRDGLLMGEEFELTIELISPNGIEKITNTHITGNLAVVGIVSQKAITVASGFTPDQEKDAEQILYEEAIKYMDRWNQAEEELSSLMHLNLARPLPTVVTLGRVIDVTYLLDTRHQMEWKGIYVDADLRTIETVASGFTPDERQKTFMQLSSLQGSILENRIFEDDFQVESISTAKLFGLARNSQPVTEVLTINKTNIDSVLPSLPFDENIKEDIQNSVNRNFIVRIPQSELTYEDWIGVGYIKENPDTGESGYMLSGMIAGGMTAWGMDRWPEYYASRLQNPYSEPPGEDPGSARFIQKIVATDLQKGKVGEQLQQPLQVKVFNEKKKPVPGVEVTFTVKKGGGKFSNGKTTLKEKTDSKGIVSVPFILGQRTWDNPTFLWETGYTYSQQVGENIVDASLTSGMRITTPFTAYGLPKEASQIKKTFGGGRWSILSFAGFVSVNIEDTYGNPISNLPVDFQVLPAVDKSRCSTLNQDMRQAVLVRRGDPCLKNSPAWGECSASNSYIQEITDSKGAAVHVILGGVPDAEYPIKATSGNLSTEFYFYTFPFGNCGGMDDPSNQFHVEHVYPADSYGNNIDAGKVGAKIPLTARIYYLREGETEKEVTLTCEDSEGNKTILTCSVIVGNRRYSTDTKFNSSSVTFDGQEGASQDNGIYTSTYTLKPGLNKIVIEGTATIGIKRKYLGCPSTCETRDENLERSDSRTIQVYGVEVQIDPIPVVLVDEDGYTTKDHTISYTINPWEYRALTSFVVISKDGDPIASIPTELQGKGTATISRGFWFDVNSVYEAEVVLNYGTGIEIRSKREKVPIGGIKVVDDNGKNVDELRFGDGSRAEKRYHVELVSKVLAESCSDLAGKISVVDKQGDIISIPVPEEMKEGFYLPKYDLDFSLTEGKCAVKIKDETAGGVTKNKFVVSNLTKEDLRNRPFDPNTLSVLYGGIGNKLAIEINNAMTEVPIEPLGIILIGIDGLRQDVLYPFAKDDVMEGAYRLLGITELPGIEQILVGFDQPEQMQKYIMLPKVTAIFPSITYASWASILTGEMPSKTGITGNEFFARDLAGAATNPIPGMEESHIPIGMVTLGAGAFQPGKGFCYDLGVLGSGCFKKEGEFVFSHAIPAEFSIFGSTASPTLSAKIANSAPLASLQTKPLFEEIGETVRDKFITPPSSSMRCDQTPYECRTVSMYHHYAKGADWWGTPTKSLENAFSFIRNRKDFAKVMDQAPANDTISFIRDYFSNNNPEGQKKRFPALFTIYLSGLDHEAHTEGMEAYSNFFKNTTDPEIGRFVRLLKEKDEYDNKIFIIVADHGMTAMPPFDKITLYPGTEDEREVIPDTSCELKVDKFNKREVQDSEKTNNNLHIWELAEILRAVGEENNENDEWWVRVLAPVKISQLYLRKDQATGQLSLLPYGAAGMKEVADLIAAFNGPVAHIYLDSPARLAKIAEIFRLALQGEYAAEALELWDMDEVDYKYLKDSRIGRLRASVDKILVRVSGDYCVFDGLSGSGGIICATGDTFDSNEYVNAWERINGMNHPQRSGDIILVMRDHAYDINQRYSTGAACKAWHGSLNKTDSYVPLILAYPGGNKDEIDAMVKKENVCKEDYSECMKNWKMPDLIREIMSEQYK